MANAFPLLGCAHPGIARFPDPRQLGIFSLGALLMRSAGATVNDIADRKFDGHVERTAFGPWQTVRSARYTPLSFWPFSLHLRLSPVLSDLLHAHRRYLRSTARVHLSALQACHPLAPSCPGCGVQLGMLMSWAQVAGHIPAGAVLMWIGGHRMADRLRYRLCLR